MIPTSKTPTTPPNVTEYGSPLNIAAEIERLDKTTQLLTESIHRAMNIAAPHMVSDPRDVKQVCSSDNPPQRAMSATAQKIENATDRLYEMFVLMQKFGDSLDA